MHQRLLVLAFFLSTLMTGNFSHAVNPQIRFCQMAGGQFLVAEINGEDYGLCQIGKAWIGALDFFYTTTRSTTNHPKSVDVFQSNKLECEQNGGITKIVILDQNKGIDLCHFEDNSFIGSETLRKGQNHPDNEKLKNALQIRY